jgi:hypothetical protein
MYNCDRLADISTERHCSKWKFPEIHFSRHSTHILINYNTAQGFTPLKLSGNQMYQLLQQSLYLYFVFMGFV